MEIEYVRNMQMSYMRLLMEGKLNRTEEEMLSRNQIEGLLTVSWQKENDKYLLRYDITGKQALDTILESHLVDEEVLLRIVSGVCQTCKCLERYLLLQDSLLLSPETIYWDTKKESMFFCYYPGKKETLQEQFVHLMEYLLTKTDHKNLRAVEIAYGVYEELLKPSYSMGEIQNRIEALRESWRQNEIPEERTENVEMVEEKRLEERKSLVRPNVKRMLEEIWVRIMAWIKPDERKHIKRNGDTDIFVFSPEDEMEKQGLPTVLLSEKSEDVEGILKYEGNAALPDLHITTVPFLIGSAGNCDGIIDDVTISRQHAKITKVDDVYFIEDLNSLNGTKVNGGLLTYKNRVSLKKDEKIYFANLPYRFL